ncbi:hypothetical protein ACFCX6_37355 [Streptomyces sp. NPDC056353]|uniref:hypothetical protein n=1 Tax=Streptomyces sp. NPDC056353 TaxID=3345792 RepID=UPI0035D994D6
MQQRLQANAARRERREGYGREAGQAALNELLQLRHHIAESREAVQGDRELADEEWFATALRCIRTAEVFTVMIPGDPELQRSMQEVFQATNEYRWSRGRRARVAKRGLQGLESITERGIEVLAAYMRGEPIPDARSQFQAIQWWP